MPKPSSIFLSVFTAVMSGCAIGDNGPAAPEAPATAYPTRAYSRERLDRTGEQTPADSLPKVDPAITITRGGR